MSTRQLPCIVCGKTTGREDAICEQCRPESQVTKHRKSRRSKSDGKITLDLSNHSKLLQTLQKLADDCKQPLENQILLLIIQGLVGFNIPEWSIEPIIKEIIDNGKKNSLD
jgi:hypothetical protein